MGLTYPLCDRAYLKPVRYSDMKTPSVQEGDGTYLDLTNS